MLWLFHPRRLTVSIAAFYQFNSSASVPRASEVFSIWHERIPHCQSYISCNPSGGFGNILATVICSGILALFFNKPIICRACSPDLFHFPWFDKGNFSAMEPFLNKDIYGTAFDRKDPRSFEMDFFSPDHLYLHNQIGSFLYSCFGEYAIYYIGNYFFSVPESIRTRVASLLSTVPPNVVSIGVHIRTHRGLLAAFMTDTKRGCALVVDFLAAQFRDRPTQVILATDVDSVVTIMKRRIPNLMRTTAVAMPDGDLMSTVLDFFMLQCCEELVLTYRSTFSLFAAALVNKTGYYYADEWPTLVRFSSSQLGLTSGVYQTEKPFNDKTNTRHHLRPAHETLLRLFNRYFVV
jgi:hypothetical protein